jgi:RimJ/RimL family protein N-acetyltransferase
LTNPPILTGSKVRLRPKSLQDAINDYSWRKDSELCRLDATQTISSSFEEFMKYYAEKPAYPSRACQFAVETFDGKHIGNCSYFNIDEIRLEAELGIMIGDRAYWNQGYGADVIKTSVNHFFWEIGLKRIHLKTLDWNIRAHKCFEKCGFTACGHLSRAEFSFKIMEIHRPDQAQQ